MRNLIITLIALIFTGPLMAGEMPGTEATKLLVPVTLKDEIAFEQTKLVTYGDAAKASKGNHLPLVALVGCYGDDIQLFLQLKGKVILVYVPAKTAPFPALESGVVVGLWNNDTCVRHDVAAYTFSDPKFRDSLLFNIQVEPSPSPTSAIMTLEQFNATYGQPPGMSCTNGKCTPTYAPSQQGMRKGRFQP